MCPSLTLSTWCRRGHLRRGLNEPSSRCRLRWDFGLLRDDPCQGKRGGSTRDQGGGGAGCPGQGLPRQDRFQFSAAAHGARRYRTRRRATTSRKPPGKYLKEPVSPTGPEPLLNVMATSERGGGVSRDNPGSACGPGARSAPRDHEEKRICTCGPSSLPGNTCRRSRLAYESVEPVRKGLLRPKGGVVGLPSNPIGLPLTQECNDSVVLQVRKRMTHQFIGGPAHAWTGWCLSSCRHPVVSGRGQSLARPGA